MKQLLMNPFKFGDPVEGEYYLPRPALARTITQFLGNRIHVVLIGPRRFGKTSFVLNLLQELEKQSYICIFIDIFNITSHRDFLQQMLRGLESKKGLWRNFKKWMGAISGLRPKISAEIDTNSGQPSIGLIPNVTENLDLGPSQSPGVGQSQLVRISNTDDVEIVPAAGAFASARNQVFSHVRYTVDKFSDKDVKESIQDLLSSLSEFGERLIFAIDEFQKISEINDQGWLEATLRTHMQQLRNTSFLFTGSRKSLIYEMLNSHTRPFYRSCQTIEFPSFGEEFTDWIINRFSMAAIKCEHKAIQHLRQLVQDTPNYVQMVCFHLVAQGKNYITDRESEAALTTVVRQNAYAYQTLLNSLTLTQQRALRLAAKEGKQIFHKQLLAKYEIASGAALASAIKALKDKGILDEEGTSRGSVIFDDPLFAIWLKSQMNNVFSALNFKSGLGQSRKDCCLDSLVDRWLDL